MDIPQQFNIGAELIERNLRGGRGDSPAIWFAGKVITYAEFSRRVDRMAAALLRAEVRREERVLLVMPDSPMPSRSSTTPSHSLSPTTTWSRSGSSRWAAIRLGVSSSWFIRGEEADFASSPLVWLAAASYTSTRSRHEARI